jgi:hypothetical protein
MEIYNTTTKEIDVLEHRFHSNVGDLIADDPNITVSDAGIRQASQDTIDFWKTWLAEDEKYESLVEAAKSELESDEIYDLDEEILRASLGIEFNDQPKILAETVENFMNEYGFDLTCRDYLIAGFRVDVGFSRREVSVA